MGFDQTAIATAGAIVVQIADIKTSHLIREYAPAYFESEGIAVSVPTMPELPPLDGIATMEALGAVTAAYARQLDEQFPEEDDHISDIMEHGKGSKFFNELPLGPAAETLFKKFLELLPRRDGKYVVDSYDLDDAVFFTDELEEAEAIASEIQPCSIYEVDRSTNPPRMLEVTTI